MSEELSIDAQQAVSDQVADFASANPGSTGTLQLENEHFRVMQWAIEPGGAIPMHRHEYEYVVIPVANGTMHVVQADGTELDSHLQLGVSYTRPSGSEHRIENHTAERVVFVEVEKLS